ncbi:hypothetical protein O6H91_04G070400 [Diphasiastrum complanatum]|uniref:Uncharacterized protein n=1 Tax=Diphasiastrum complanatum TaxID=34168 RepID=A0ACC2DXV6_DIPCM|nr:hypothetical protein O6H91_Y412500 [Diphasiastrum complanatum]KAJ7559111.1 hypothetical protein O6H91_04G070400 [Diphasiastrum complanatum]
MWNAQCFLPGGLLNLGERNCNSAPCSPLKPRVKRPVASRADSFHVIHKVPVGDSPYVRAKHVQLVDKDPDRAIALFWAAINAGDRVESALKDMAIVMKQQDRPEEAIEAIKSLRNRCSEDSQEALDNILLDLYKRCGRLDDQIALLKNKLQMIHEGLAFNGKRTKTARSQGKKFQVSIEQEATRLLGNLGWAYMQQSNYVAAEAVYRKALSIEHDYNKMCNLGICLMKQGRLEEAKVTLQSVTSPRYCDNSCGSNSHLKSYERAQQVLFELESAVISGHDRIFANVDSQQSATLSPRFSKDHNNPHQTSYVQFASESSSIDGWDEEDEDAYSVDENLNVNIHSVTVRAKEDQNMHQQRRHTDALRHKSERVHQVDNRLDENRGDLPKRNLNIEAPPFTMNNSTFIRTSQPQNVPVIASSLRSTGSRDYRETLPFNDLNIYNNVRGNCNHSSALPLRELTKSESSIGWDKSAEENFTAAKVDFITAQNKKTVLQNSKPASKQFLLFESSDAVLPVNSSTTVAMTVVGNEAKEQREESGITQISVESMDLDFTCVNSVIGNVVPDCECATEALKGLPDELPAAAHISALELEMRCRRRLQIFLDMTFLGAFPSTSLT